MSIVKDISTGPSINDFIIGGGEMGALIRAYDWSQTPAGPPLSWPQSLKTILGILVNTRFPMFIFWGPDLICFYNDAYRPSLGNEGKHPTALGRPGKEVWPEIWDVIKPLIDQILAGGDATWSEDQLIPIYRNGKLEDVYWTFSYSPIRDDAGKIAGVFVTCFETTEKIKKAKKIEHSEEAIRHLFAQAPVGISIYKGPEYIIESINDKALNIWGKKEKDVLGKPLFEAMPEFIGQDFDQILDGVYYKGIPFYANGLKTEIQRDGKTETLYFNAALEPIYEADGQISGMISIGTDVTELINTQMKLQESENNFRNLVMQAPVGIALLSGDDFVVELANDLYLQMVGKGKDFVGKPLWESLPEVKDQGFDDLLKEVIKTGKPYRSFEYKVELMRNELETIYINFVYEPIFNADGKVNRIMVLVIEVTDQVMARQKIADAEERARLATEAAELGTFDIDLETDQLIISARVNEIFGMSKNASRQEIINAIHPDDKIIRDQAYANAHKTGRLFYEARTIWKDKSIHWFRAQGKVYYDISGKPGRLLGTVLDITEEKDAAEKLTNTANRLELALKAGRLGSYELEIETGEMNCTELCKQNFGLHKEDDLNLAKLVSMVVPEDKDKMQNAVKDAIANNHLYSCEYRVMWPDKSIHWIYAVGLPKYNAEGKPLQLTGVTADVTEQKLFEEELSNKVAERTKELAESNLQLQHTNNELEQFAYIASHDLQEPLRKVRTFTEILENHLGSVDSQTKIYLDKINSSSNRMLTLIRDVLNFSQLSKNGKEFRKTDLNVILENVKSDFELLIEQTKAVIIADKLPVIEGIPLQLNQLFGNLISNSLKFVKQNENPEIHIQYSLLTADEIMNIPNLNVKLPYCKISFIDNGIGFRQEYADQIFTIFQRLHDRQSYLGTGIGLALCRKIVLNHQGWINTSATEGQGARFDVILPLQQA